MGRRRLLDDESSVEEPDDVGSSIYAGGQSEKVVWRETRVDRLYATGVNVCKS
jgi:hypothetical protein